MHTHNLHTHNAVLQAVSTPLVWPHTWSIHTISTLTMLYYMLSATVQHTSITVHTPKTAQTWHDMWKLCSQPHEEYSVTQKNTIHSQQQMLNNTIHHIMQKLSTQLSLFKRTTTRDSHFTYTAMSSKFFSIHGQVWEKNSPANLTFKRALWTRRITSKQAQTASKLICWKITDC